MINLMIHTMIHVIKIWWDFTLFYSYSCSQKYQKPICCYPIATRCITSPEYQYCTIPFIDSLLWYSLLMCYYMCYYGGVWTCLLVICFVRMTIDVLQCISDMKHCYDLCYIDVVKHNGLVQWHAWSFMKFYNVIMLLWH